MLRKEAVHKLHHAGRARNCILKEESFCEDIQNEEPSSTRFYHFCKKSCTQEDMIYGSLKERASNAVV